MGILSLIGRISVTSLGVVGLPATEWLNETGLYSIFFVLCAFGSIAVGTFSSAEPPAKDGEGEQYQSILNEDFA